MTTARLKIFVKTRPWIRTIQYLLIFSIFLLQLEIFTFPLKNVLQDLMTLALLVMLVRIFSSIGERIYLSRKSLDVMPILRRRTHSATWHWVHGFVTLFSIIALLVWLSHWFHFDAVKEMIPIRRKEAFLHAGLTVSFISFLMVSRRFTLWWNVLDLTAGRMVFLAYGFASIAGAFLLILPISLHENASIGLVDALFVSVSALTVTGLSPVTLPQTFSLFGQSIILFLIQIGGLGIVAISVGLAVITRSRLSISQSLMGRTLYDVPQIGNVKGFLTQAIIFTFAAETIGAFWIYLFLPEDLPLRFFHALFHSISAFCNAGFSTFGNNLDIPGLFLFKSVVLILIFLGGFGFPMLFELTSRLRPARLARGGWRRPLTANTLLTCLVTGGLMIAGWVAISLTEIFASSGSYSVLHDLGHGLFYSVASRTAGFNVSDMTRLSYGSQLILAFLMIIGGGPVSTAGGIKTTTAGVVIVAAISLLKGHKWIQFHGREISYLALQRAVAVMVLYTGTLLVAMLLLLGIEPHDPWSLTFETISALSTTGLSLGVTTKLSSISKIIVIGLMICGRLGLVTMVYIGLGRVDTQKFRYAKEYLYVG